jgi:hypothetical protein
MYVAPDGRHASIEIVVSVDGRWMVERPALYIRLEEIQDRLGQRLERALWGVEGMVELDEVAIMDHGIQVRYPITVGDRTYSSAGEFHSAVAEETDRRIGGVVYDSTGRAFTLHPWVAVFHQRAP